MCPFSRRDGNTVLTCLTLITANKASIIYKLNLSEGNTKVEVPTEGALVESEVG